MANKIIVSTPKGSVLTYKTKSGRVRAEIKWNAGFGARRTSEFQTAQSRFDQEVMKQLEKYMQKDTGAMIMSMTLASNPGSGEVVINTPYARRRYYEGRANGMRGPRHFDRMKAAKREYLRRYATQQLGGK